MANTKDPWLKLEDCDRYNLEKLTKGEFPTYKKPKLKVGTTKLQQRILTRPSPFYSFAQVLTLYKENKSKL